MGDFGKKNSCRLISSEKKFLQRNNWGKKFTPLKKISFMAYNPGKKSYTTPLYVGEKNSITRGLEEQKSHPNQITHQK